MKSKRCISRKFRLRFTHKVKSSPRCSHDIGRAVENIRAITTVYTAIVEVVVNAIEAIDARGKSGGQVLIRAFRSAQLETDGSLPEIQSFEIEDNGVGFTDEHRDSFDTLYSDLKIKDGGKGFGRFICLKYFDNVRVCRVTLKLKVAVLRNQQFTSWSKQAK